MLWLCAGMLLGVYITVLTFSLGGQRQVDKLKITGTDFLMVNISWHCKHLQCRGVGRMGRGGGGGGGC